MKRHLEENKFDSPNELFSFYYSDPSVGGVGMVRFGENLKKLGIPFTNKELKDWYSSYTPAEINQPIQRNQLLDRMKTIHVPKCGYIQADLMDFRSYKNTKLNKGYQYILTAIDTYSREAKAIPLLGKEEKYVLPAVKQLYEWVEKAGYDFITLTSDPGSEFTSRSVQEFLTSKGIKLYRDKTGYHSRSALIERFNLTLRTNLQRLMTVHDSIQWVPYLDDVVSNYNGSPQRGIGKQIPETIWDDKKKNNENYDNRDARFLQKFNALKVGTKVRILTKKPKLGRTITTFSRDVYTITRIEQLHFYVKDSDGDELPDFYLLWELKPLKDETKIVPSNIHHQLKNIKQNKKQEQEMKQEGVDEGDIIEAQNNEEAVPFQRYTRSKKPKN